MIKLHVPDVVRSSDLVSKSACLFTILLFILHFFSTLNKNLHINLAFFLIWEIKNRVFN